MVLCLVSLINLKFLMNLFNFLDTTYSLGEEFVASASSTVKPPSSPEPPNQAFNYVTQNSPPMDWNGQNSPYTVALANGLKGYAQTTFSTVIDNVAYYGEWLQLKTGLARSLGAYSIQATQHNPGRVPGQFVVAGSVDGVSWTLIDSQTTLTVWTVFSIQTFVPPVQSRAFTHFRLVVLATGSTGDNLVSIEEWMLYPGAVTACAAGTYAVSGSTACAACAAGSFSNTTGTTVCDACAKGLYAAAGSSACATCPNNTGIVDGGARCAAVPGYAWATTGGRFPSSPMTGATTTVGGEQFAASASSTVSVGNPESPYQAFNYVTRNSPPMDWTTKSQEYLTRLE
jgi:hypothetical protein